MSDKRKKDITSIEDILKSEFGKDSLLRFDGKNTMEISTISTGSIQLDHILSNKGVQSGLPLGRIIEIYGAEQSGKTTLSLHVIKNAQKLAQEEFDSKKCPILRKCAFIDAECSFNRELAENVGIDMNKLLFIYPENAEQAIEMMDRMCRSNQVSVIVLDSVAAMIPKIENENSMNDSQMIGLQARLMSRALRKLTPIAKQSNTMIIFINQVRVKVGGYGGPPGMIQYVTTGGTALKFYASVRLQIYKKRLIEDKGQVIGQHTRVKVTKNKIVPPFREIIFDLIYGHGIDTISELIQLGRDYELIDMRGSYYCYHFKEQEIKAQGKLAFSQLIKNDKELRMDLETKVKNKLIGSEDT